jgi:penicillin amidase
MDAIDAWVEDCRDGRYRRGEGAGAEWEPFRSRAEVIRRRGKSDVTVTFYENDHGVLEGDPHVPGLYLASRWASGEGTGAASLHAFFRLLHAPDVTAGMELIGTVETAWNWVLADRHGNIGYQMSGKMPLRRPDVSGFTPLAGWDPANDWRGFVAPEDLPRAYNPASGYLVTANEDLNHLGRARPINMPMGPYRSERIAALLAERNDWTVDDMRQMQMDVRSTHAERFLEVLRPLLPDSSEGRLLRDWDRCYDLKSRGATLFERFYRALVLEVFGTGCSPDAMDFIWRETGILTDFYYNFDLVLLREQSVWYGAEGRDATWKRIAAAALPGVAMPWGRERKLLMKHLLLGGRLPRFLGIDRGPIELRGNRATIHQGQIYRSGGRDTSFAPSFRMVTDLGTAEVHTAMAGGPSDRPFSRWYASGIKDWLAGRLKKLGPRPDA